MDEIISTRFIGNTKYVFFHKPKLSLAKAVTGEKLKHWLEYAVY